MSAWYILPSFESNLIDLLVQEKNHKKKIYKMAAKATIFDFWMERFWLFFFYLI